MKTIVAGVWVTWGLAGACAQTHVPPPSEEVPLRGTVLTRGPAVKAVRAGPAVIHAYSAFGGGDLYVVPVVTGTDADCTGTATDAAARAQEAIPADRRVTVRVAATELMCLATNAPGNFELLWHAHEEPLIDVTTIAVARRTAP
jgi:hypothetical protein